MFVVVSSVKLLCNRVIDIQIQHLLISKVLHSYIYTLEECVHIVHSETF